MSRLKIWDASTSTWLYPGGGNTVGASSSTDNAIARFDGVSGQVIQNSLVTVNDTGDISTGGNVSVGGDGSSSTSGNGTITITSNFGTSATIQATGSSANLSVNKALDMGSHKITGVTDPTSNQDVATKNYADTASTIYHPSGTDVAVADGGTGVSTITGIIKGNGTSAMTAASAGTDYLAPTSTIQTRISSRTSTTTSSSSITPDVSSIDQYNFTALAANLTVNAPTGTPVDGDKLLFRFKDNSTTRTLTWNSIFRSIGVTIPTTTISGKTVYVLSIYNSSDAKWDVLSVGQE